MCARYLPMQLALQQVFGSYDMHNDIGAPTVTNSISDHLVWHLDGVTAWPLLTGYTNTRSIEYSYRMFDNRLGLAA